MALAARQLVLRTLGEAGSASVGADPLGSFAVRPWGGSTAWGTLTGTASMPEVTREHPQGRGVCPVFVPRLPFSWERPCGRQRSQGLAKQKCSLQDPSLTPQCPSEGEFGAD